MKNIHTIPEWIVSGCLLILLMACRYEGYAQFIRGGNPASSDTVTYVLYGNGLSFNSRRTIIFTDKHSVDSLANILAAGTNAERYHIIYQKMGQQAREITARDFRKLDRSGLFQITIAYKKRALSTDHKALYILSSR